MVAIEIWTVLFNMPANGPYRNCKLYSE